MRAEREGVRGKRQGGRGKGGAGCVIKNEEGDMKKVKIRKTALMVVFIMAAAGLFAVPSFALFDVEGGWLPEKAEDMPEISASQAFFTKYIWRGWNLGDEPVMQNDVTLSWYGLSFNFWTNYSLNNDKEKDSGRYQEFTEIDYTISYGFNVGEAAEFFSVDMPEALRPIGISGGYIYYTFPNVDWNDKFFDSHEIFLGVSYDTFLSPEFTWYWDVGRGKGNSDGGGNGSYFEFGISHTVDLGETGASATLGMTTGIINEQWTDKTGLGDMVFSLGVDIPLLNYFTVTPSVAYSVVPDRDVYNDNSSNEFFGGITVSFSY